MISKAIDRIIELSAPQTITVEGKEFSKDHLYEVRPQIYSPTNVTVSSLTSLVDLVKIEATKLEEMLFINIISPTKIEVFSDIHPDYSERVSYYDVIPESLPFRTGTFSHEEFVILLRSACVQDDNTEDLLKALSVINMNEGMTSHDNGVSQEVTARKGISLQEKVKLNPRVTLSPYRTFLEVEQPASEFLFRLTNDMQIKLVEADGGAWRLEAKQRIYDYLIKAFDTCISQGYVTILR